MSQKHKTAFFLIYDLKRSPLLEYGFCWFRPEGKDFLSVYKGKRPVGSIPMLSRIKTEDKSQSVLI